MINLIRKVLCLDWDKRSLRMVVARVRRGYMLLEDAHSHRLPSGVDPDDPAAMGDFIRQMLRRHRLHYKSVVLDVTRERAVINRLTLPPTPDAEVAAAVRFQAMKELPFPLESAAADYVITGRDENGLANEVLLAAVTLETLDRVRATCAAAGLEPARIGLRPYANLVSARHVSDELTREVLFVDVGPAATEIDVISGDALAFARSANVSVPLPTGDAAAREDSRITTLVEAGDLEAADKAIEAAVDELLVEVTRTLQSYRAAATNAVVSRAIVAGGTGLEAQLADALNRKLGFPVELFDPTVPLRVEASEAPKLRSFSAALGLAWGLSREGLLALDFLNPKRPVSKRETLRRRAQIGAVAAGILLALVAGALGKRYWNLSGQLAELRRQNAELRNTVLKRLDVQNQVTDADEWARGAVWPDELLRITQAAIEPGQDMVVQALTLDGESRSPGITLRNVFAADWQVPMRFVSQINELKVDGVTPYEAALGQWSELPAGGKYKGKVDVRIELRKLREFRDHEKDREKARKSARDKVQ